MVNIITQIDDKNINEISLFSIDILDYSGNYMLDSVKTINMADIIDSTNNDFKSSINGTIKGNKLQNKIIVQAINQQTGKVYSTINNLNKFKLNNINPGNYRVWAFFMDNEVDSLRYFSGTLDPYKPSSKYIVVNDTIEVRKNWDIEGLIINFK